ncbi:MAG: hypothetical protein AAB209_08270 [Bacteroidota bacterium]
MRDSYRVEIDGKTVTLKMDQQVIRETPLKDFVRQLVLLSDKTIFDDPLPDGVRFVRKRGERATLVVIEVRPQYRMVKWIDDISPTPYGPGTMYQKVRLAFPYIVLFVLFVEGELSGYQQAYYRTEPITSQNDGLLYPNLRNCTDYRGMKCCLCLGHGDHESVARLPWDQKINRVVEYLWSRGFNKSSETHNQTPYWTMMHDVDRRISSIEAWQKASVEDPSFPLKVKWKSAGVTVKQVADKMLDNASRPVGINSADDLFHIMSHCEFLE